MQLYLNLTQASELYDWLNQLEQLRHTMCQCMAQLNELSAKAEVFERWVESWPVEASAEAIDD